MPLLYLTRIPEFRLPEALISRNPSETTDSKSKNDDHDGDDGDDGSEGENPAATEDELYRLEYEQRVLQPNRQLQHRRDISAFMTPEIVRKLSTAELIAESNRGMMISNMIFFFASSFLLDIIRLYFSLSHSLAANHLKKFHIFAPSRCIGLKLGNLAEPSN